ncbi:hypothetical protein HII12_004950 [Brettanomyces bruxellensis]|uniref:Autophagy-related protein n=1 Tax=Dekkera bruxellensis TaxID=5007 RepID=A0A8H6EQQ5_DEKBR|nr:hypothetical protein HII12_004950 [Brettanomyces bruxellensis]
MAGLDNNTGLDDDVSSESPLVHQDTSYSDNTGQHNEDIDNNKANLNDNTAPTSMLEILGWCLYAWASEPFIVSCVGTYVPIILEQIARDNGVQSGDKISPCKGSRGDPGDGNMPLPPPMMNNTSSALASAPNDASCVLSIFNGKLYIDTSSYALYTFSFSVLIQTICVIAMSGAADRGSYRKTFLILFGIFGALTTMCYWFVRPDGYYAASVLAIVANSAYGCVNVCGNSFLSVLVNNSRDIRTLRNIPSTEDDENTEEDQLTLSTVNTRVGELSSKISGAGAASGYVAALIVQVGTMLMLMAIRNKADGKVSVMGPVKVVIGFVGLWWLLFQIPICAFLKSRASPDLDLSYISHPVRQEYSIVQYQLAVLKYKLRVVKVYIEQGFLTLVDAFHQASKLRDITCFLLGWFVLSDSLTTINSAAILFAKSELGMNTIQLSRISILAMISAVVGSGFIPGYIQTNFGIDIKSMLLVIILWSSVIPLYGILGFFFDTIGLHHAGEMYILAIWYGFSLGGVATISRSMYSMLIPIGQESVFFALFSITDKGSSVLGPFLVGLVIDATHEIRYCFGVLLGLLMLSIPIFWYGVEVDRGVKEAATLSASRAAKVATNGR